MQQNLQKPFFSRTKIVGLFAVLTLLLTLPLTMLVSQQREDVRSKASEPTKAIVPTAQGIGFISGYVYHDQNKDGERGSEEKSFGNVKITITQIRQSAQGQMGTSNKSDDIVSNLTTDSNGYFKFPFSNLLPDSITYMVKVVLPDDYKTINTNPVIFSDLHKNAKEIVEFGLFPLDDHASLSLKCAARPVCLDKTPKCVLPEPAEGWCPAPSTAPSETPIPTASACVPRPACLDATPSCKLPEPAKGWCPK